MIKDVNVLNLYRKIICSLLCINKNTKNDDLRLKSSIYLDKYLEQYKLYNDKCICLLDNIEDVISFCNSCYEDKDVFDFAEDLEYGLKELFDIVNK